MTRRQRYFLYGIVFILSFIAISLWNFYSVTHPLRIEALFSPAQFSLPAEDITILGDDGIKLSGWLIEPEHNIQKRAIIILHGYPAEKSDMLFIAESLYPDFTLLLLDLRYFGESEGNYTTLGIKEKNDVRRAIDFLEKRGYTRIGIFGFSLGGAIGFLASAHDNRVKALASYASFSDLKTLGHDAYWRLWILKKPMVELMALWTHLFFKEPITAISPEGAARGITIPVFVSHSENDDQIPFSHALRLQVALEHNTHAEYYFWDRRAHGDLPVDFYQKLKSFFIKSL